MEIIWVSTAFVCGLLVRYAYLPPLVGYLAAGFLLNYFSYESTDLLDKIAHIGVLLLLFSVGLKIRLKNLIRPEVLAGSLIHLFIVAGIFIAIFVFYNKLDISTAFIIAIALGFSSTVVAAKVLEQKKELRAFHGRVAIGILIMQDLVAVVLLSLSGEHDPSPWAFLILALPLLRPFAHKMLDISGHDELLILYGLLLAIVIGGSGFENLGLSSELGALLLGVILADHPRASELSNSLWSLKEVFLVGFFLQIGMMGLPGVDSLIFALLLVLLIPLKAILFFFVLIMFRLRARSSFLAALCLATYSEFGLIIAHMGVKNQWFGTEWLVSLAFAVALSFIIAAPVNRIAHSLYQRYESKLTRFESKQRHPDDEPIHLGSARFLIVGMGRVGHRAYDFLSQREQRCVGLDSDPGAVEKHIKQGRRVLYADAEDPSLWHNLHLNHIDAVLLAMPDLEANTIAASQLRQRGFGGLISATSVYPEHVDAIIEAGADVAYNYFDEVGVGFAEHVWENLHSNEFTNTK